MGAVEIIGLILAIIILIKHLPTLLAFNFMKNRLRKFEKTTDKTINNMFWATFIVFLVLLFFILPVIGLLNFLVAGVVYSLLISLLFTSRPQLYRSMIREVLRAPSGWMRIMSLISVIIAVLMLWLLFR